MLMVLFVVSISCSNGPAEHTHNWGEWVVVEQATCLSEELSERVCSCGEKEIRRDQTTGHASKTWIIDKKATPTECGKKHQICSTCNKTFNEKTTPSLRVTRLPGVTDGRQNQLRPHYELANCRHLKGSPVVVLLFIDDNKSYWTKDEVLTFTQEQILPGLKYLEKKASEWGVDLNFVVESYSTSLSNFEIKYEGIVNPNLYNGGSTKDVLDKAAADIGFESNWDLYSYYKSQYPDDDIIFLNFLNKSGKSYTRNAISPGYSEYSEHCVIFADYLGSSSDARQDGSRASTVAHEILHLFGAEDYYTSYSREQLANQKYPNDIMLWQYDNIEENLIGDFTAFSVGWTNSVPQVCYNSKWWE
jgi:hypothetical protein